jgi:hypothetical protein
MVGGAFGAANCRNVHAGVTLMNNFSEKVSFTWGVADLLRGDYKQSEYGRVMLPFLVLRRLDQVLAPTRDAVWAADYIHAVGKVPEKFVTFARPISQAFFVSMGGYLTVLKKSLPC